MKRSLRNRMLGYLCLPLVLGFLAIGAGSYYSAKVEAGKIYDAQLAHFAQVLHELTQYEISQGGKMKSGTPIRMQPHASFTPYEKDLAYWVWMDDQLLLQSPHAGMLSHKTHTLGFTDRTIGAQPMRMFMLRQGNLTVEVAENYTARTDLIHHIALSILIPSFFIIPLMAAAVWWGLRIGLKPLNNISSIVAKMNPAALQPLSVTMALPRELEPFVASINQLMARVEEVIEREKRFTGYAAHELRTPLAALKTQLQVARREKDNRQRQHMYDDAVAGVDLMTHLVNQLLLLLRSQKGEEVLSELNLSQLVQEVVRDFAQTPVAKEQKLISTIQPDVHSSGNADMLRIMLRNLLDNAVRYSPAGAEIQVNLQRKTTPEKAGRWQLLVHNSGVSLTAEECLHMFEPFYRGKQNTSSGAGLGLAIVSWIALMHGFQLHADSDGNGLTVRIGSRQ